MRRRGALTLALDGPPPITLGLRRFVLRSVGPAAARFHPLDLDLVAPDGSLARRALCVLTNTGGKSTLLKLLSAVINPGTAGLIGKGEIADMVLATDTSHVVLEWQQADGARYVTGWVAEWNGLQKSHTGTRGLHQCWYTFRVNGMGVDDLPFEYEGRRTRLNEYRRQLRGLFDEHKGALGYIADTQVAWGRALIDRTRIDSELFRYQATMNAAESGAAALVTRLKTPEAFVGFFVAAFDDDALTVSLFREIATYTTQAADRAAKETHADLCAELVQALDQFRNEEMNYAAALDMEALDTERRRELAGSVRARAAVEGEKEAEAAETLDAEATRLAATNRAIDGDEDRRKQYLLLEADIRHASALAASAEAEVAEQAADFNQRAWSVVPAVVAHDTAVSVHSQAKAAFDAAESELAPLRGQVEHAAGLLVAGLTTRATQATAQAAEAGHRSEQARAASTEAVGRREKAIQEAAGLRRELATADAEAARAVHLGSEGRRRGDIAAGETAAAASVRWLSVQQEATAHRQRALAERDRQSAVQREAVQDRAAAEMARGKASVIARQAVETLVRAAESCARLTRDPDVAAVIGEAPADVASHRAVSASVAAEAAAAIDGQAAEVERSSQDTYADLRSIQAELGRLSGTDLLDAGEDVARAVEVLREAQVGAVTGWTWLAGTVAVGDRLAFIAGRPDIANGVVVSDPLRLEDARKALEKAGLFPRLAVVVATSKIATSTADTLPAADPSRFVVDPHPGLYDKKKAEEEIARLGAQEQMLVTRHDEQQARGRELRVAAGLARRHSQEWSDTLLDATERQNAEAQQAIAEAQQREEGAAAALKVAVEAEERAVLDEQAAAEEHEAAGAARLRLSAAVQAETTAAIHAVQRPGIVERIARHDRDSQIAGQEAADAVTAGEQAAAEQRESEEVARASRERAAQINAVAAPAPPVEPVHVLEARYAELDRRLIDEAAGRDHHEALRRAEASVIVAAEPFSAVADVVLAAARERSTSVLAGTAAAVRSQAAAAVEAWKAALHRRSECQHKVERWANEVERHRPTDRQVHVVLGPEDTPADADDAARRASEMDSRLVASRALAARQASARDAAERARDAARSEASAFARLVSDQDAPVATADPYEGDVDAAYADLDQRRKAVGYAKDLVNDARLARQRATAEVNKRANNRRWADIANSLKELCASATAETLADHGERYIDGLRMRESSLRDDIANLDTHRATVIQSLGQTCDRLRRNLRQVKSASTLPTRVGNVGGHHTISIDFKPLPVEVANAALFDVIDEWATAGADLADSRARQSRLIQALSATVENRPMVGRWSVRLLKPRIDGDVTYCAPDRVTKEYSGGQELTLALLLYCALVAVRANDRTGSDRPPGLLLLDNPFGAASNERLIEMWQKLAEEADVQLLCFTALSEPSILNGFNGPGTFRQTLRNDRDQRNGHLHVRAIGADGTTARRVATHLAGPELEGGEESRVHGLTYQTKPPFPVEAPPPGLGGCDPETDE